MNEQMIARFYVDSESSQEVWLKIPGTHYKIQARPTGPVNASPQGRVRGVLRLPVWKVDRLTPGGAFVEPIFGRPRRVQGKVIAGDAEGNRIVVEVCGQPIVGELPGHIDVSTIAVGTRVGLDIKEGAVFCPAANAEAGVPGRLEFNSVNLSVT